VFGMAQSALVARILYNVSVVHDTLVMLLHSPL
jgi:hypothetical protein